MNVKPKIEIQLFFFVFLTDNQWKIANIFGQKNGLGLNTWSGFVLICKKMSRKFFRGLSKLSKTFAKAAEMAP